MTYTLVFRRYAPFATFGGGFEGDHRAKASTDLRATARTIGIIGFSPGHVGALTASSSGTAFTGAGPFVARLLGRHFSTVTSSVSVSTKTVDCVRFTAQTAGANPMVPKAPAIDTFVDFEAVFRSSAIEISGGVRGDDFPNAEVFILDKKGSAVLLLAFATEGGRNTGPITRLAGDNSTQALGVLNRRIPVKAPGVFR
ncbi:MAG TPA: hypothetical protein VGN07_09680 [Steroidobacteraceae bacterium]|jgi:hypothetical protein